MTEAVETECQQTIALLRTARDQSQISLQRLQSLQSFLTKLALSYPKAIKKPTDLTLGKFIEKMSGSTGPLAPGIPGSVFSDICYSCEFSNNLKEDINRVFKYINETMVPQLTDFIKTFNDNLEAQFEFYFEQFSVRNQAQQRFLAAKQHCESLYKASVKLYEKYNSLKMGSNPKLEKQLSDDMLRIPKQYHESIVSTKAAVECFNKEHNKLMKTANYVMDSIYEIEKRRIIFLKTLVQEFTETCLNVKTNVVPFVKDNGTDFKTEMINFLSMTGISRRSIPLSFFKPIKVADDSFPIARFLRVPYNSATPMYVVKAKVDFKGENPNELSFKKGQYISLYEQKNNTWCLASIENNKKMGYIPSEAVESINLPTAITINTKLIGTQDELITVPGMIVIVLEKGATKCLCQDLFGNKGTIDTQKLIFEDL